MLQLIAGLHCAFPETMRREKRNYPNLHALHDKESGIAGGELHALPERMELRNRAYATRKLKRWQKWLLYALLLVMAVLPLVLIWRLLPADADWAKLFEGMWGSIRENSGRSMMTFLLPVAALLPHAYQALAQWRERIHLSSEGISYCSPLPRFLQFLYPSWVLRWGEVTHAEMSTDKKLLRGAGGLVLTLTAPGIIRKVRPYLWIDIDQTEFETPIQRMRRENKASSEEMVTWLKQSHIFRFAQRYISDLRLGTVNPESVMMINSFSLEKNAASLTVLVIFFISTAYLILDVLGFKEHYAVAPPWDVFVVAGFLVMSIAVIALRVGKVPVAESWVLALLLGVVVGAALHPGLRRINALTDQTGLQSYSYALEPDARLIPEQEDVPVLSLQQYWDYWAQFEAGSVHEFELRKGGLGFYQLNMAPFYENTRAFYDQQP